MAAHLCSGSGGGQQPRRPGSDREWPNGRPLRPQQRACGGQQCIGPWLRTATLEVRASCAWARCARLLGWVRRLECAHQQWRRPACAAPARRESHWQLQRGCRGDDLARHSDVAWRARSARAAGRALRRRAGWPPAPAAASCWRPAATLRRQPSGDACRGSVAGSIAWALRTAAWAEHGVLGLLPRSSPRATKTTGQARLVGPVTAAFVRAASAV